ncbi:hypothetical protein MXB_1695, partial [Myxobolus squamalis]
SLNTTSRKVVRTRHAKNSQYKDMCAIFGGDVLYVVYVKIPVMNITELLNEGFIEFRSISLNCSFQCISAAIYPAKIISKQSKECRGQTPFLYILIRANLSVTEINLLDSKERLIGQTILFFSANSREFDSQVPQGTLKVSNIKISYNLMVKATPDPYEKNDYFLSGCNHHHSLWIGIPNHKIRKCWISQGNKNSSQEREVGITNLYYSTGMCFSLSGFMYKSSEDGSFRYKTPLTRKLAKCCFLNPKASE